MFLKQVTDVRIAIVPFDGRFLKSLAVFLFIILPHTSTGYIVNNCVRTGCGYIGILFIPLIILLFAYCF